MKNFIFKSSLEKTDLYKIQTKLDLILKEQRMQRSDLQEIKRALDTRLLPDTNIEYEGIDDGISDTEHGK